MKAGDAKLKGLSSQKENMSASCRLDVVNLYKNNNQQCDSRLAFFTRKKGKTTMKKTLLKVLSSTIALTLVATAAIGTAPKKEIPVQEVNARPAQEETVKENTILDLVEEKIQEEKTAEVKVVKEAPAPVAVKAAPAEKAAEPEKAAEEQAVPEVKAPEAVEEIKTAAPEAEENAEPVMVWDVSATEFDDVAMAFYAEPKATEQVEMDTQTGTVYIRGTGAMEEAVYSHFMSAEKFLATAEALFEEYYGVDVDLVYDETITDVVELDSSAKYINHETGEELFVTDEMRDNLNPADFLEFSPKTVIIEEGITNVSVCAFLFCADLETVILPSTIETIDEGAFEHCDSLASIVIPEDATIEYGAFAYCDSLKDIQLVNADYYANGGVAAAHADGENTGIRTLNADEVNAYVNCWA